MGDAGSMRRAGARTWARGKIDVLSDALDLLLTVLVPGDEVAACTWRAG